VRSGLMGLWTISLIWDGPGGSSLINSTSWGVLVVQPSRHSAVAEALTSRGVDHFIPAIEDLTIVRGRHQRAMRPLLGEYVLIAICSIWKSLIRIRGVSGILLNESGMPAQVLSHELQRLREMCPHDVFHVPVVEVEADVELQYGQNVRANYGPFANHVGKYWGKTKRGDAALFFLFGREQRVEFKSGDLLAV